MTKKIVAILEVNDNFYSDEPHTLDEEVERFIGYYDYPTGDKETVIVTKNNFYGTKNIDTHTFNWGKDF